MMEAHKNEIKSHRNGSVEIRKGASATQALEISALYKISQLISVAAGDLDNTLAAILKILNNTLQMERGTLYLLDEKRKNLRIRASCGLSTAAQRRGVYRFDEGIIGKVFRTAEPFIVPDISREPLFLNRTRARSIIAKSSVSFIGVPVFLDGRPEGVLSVDRLFGPDIQLEDDMRFLMVLSTLISQFLGLNRTIIREKRQLKTENKSLKALLHAKFNQHFIVGNSKAMQDVFWNIERVAPSTATVLLLGESGTGKELVARAIHEASPRRHNAFIRINCAALPAQLLESELFGYDKGAFTGAASSRPGRFELADKGTIFLDEIGEIPVDLQAKILRVLQEQQFERLGSAVTRQVDVRVIAATNVNLEEAVSSGTFRADLYYRLNVVPINLPPLRDRREDIPLLLDHFLRLSNQRNGRNIRMSGEFLDFLTQYHWPGNVRELQNLVERLVILSTSDVLTVSDLEGNLRTPLSESPETFKSPAEPAPVNASHAEEVINRARKPGKSLREIEREEVIAALERHGWIQIRAAKELGLTQRQIGYRIKKYNIRKPDYLNLN